MLMLKRIKYCCFYCVFYEGKVKGRNEIINGDFVLVVKEGVWIINC